MASPGIMGFQAGIKVFCKSGVESFLIDLGLEDIDIVEFHPPSPVGFGATSSRVQMLRTRPLPC